MLYAKLTEFLKFIIHKKYKKNKKRRESLFSKEYLKNIICNI